MGTKIRAAHRAQQMDTFLQHLIRDQKLHRAPVVSHSRACGECTVCCTDLAVEEIGKPGHQPCPHACNGCSIYSQRPHACRVWSCAWLLGTDVGERPDRSGFTVNLNPNTIPADVASGTVVVVARHASVLEHPALRAWLAAAELCAVVTVVEGELFRMHMMIPTAITPHGQWEVTRGALYRKRGNDLERVEQ